MNKMAKVKKDSYYFETLGSVLGTLLFLIVLNELPKKLKPLIEFL